MVKLIFPMKRLRWFTVRRFKKYKTKQYTSYKKKKERLLNLYSRLVRSGMQVGLVMNTPHEGVNVYSNLSDQNVGEMYANLQKNEMKEAHDQNVANLQKNEMQEAQENIRKEILEKLGHEMHIIDSIGKKIEEGISKLQAGGQCADDQVHSFEEAIHNGESHLENTIICIRKRLEIVEEMEQVYLDSAPIEPSEIRDKMNELSSRLDKCVPTITPKNRKSQLEKLPLLVLVITALLMLVVSIMVPYFI